MRIIKKLTYILLVAVTGTVIAVVPIKAATKLKITTDTLNLREKASTDSDILTLLSQDETCDLISEEGDWYKVKYKTYTGYITKEYAEKEEDTTKSDTENDASNETKNDEGTKSESSQNEVENSEAQQESDKSQSDNSEANQDNSNSQEGDNKSNSGESESAEGSSAKESEAIQDVTEITTAKMVDKTDVKLLPLIYSSNISTLSKGASVTVISETTGWVYIQTDTIAGWVRSVDITDKKKTTDSDTNATENKTDSKKDDDSKTDTEQEDNNKEEQTFKEKVMYTNDSYVNLRKKASTDSDIVMTVETNTKLTVIGEEGDWYKVKTSQGNAYVLKELLSTKQVTTSRGNTLKKKTTVSATTTADATKTTNSASQSSKTTTASTEATTSSTAKQSSTEASTKASSSTTASSKSSTTSSSSSKGSNIVAYAKKFLGVPYVYGGASKSGFDCSGFTMYVYKNFGIKLPHGATSQSKYGKSVKVDKSSSTSIKNNLQAGDLILFTDYQTMSGIGHCGIYIGNGKFIHASSGSGYCVRTDSLLPGNYYNTRYCGARRLI